MARAESQPRTNRTTRLLSSSCVLAFLLFPIAASAQPKATARIIRTAVIVDQPRGDAFVITKVPPGVVIEVLAQQGQWYQVKLLTDGGATGPSGWVHRDLLELLPNNGSEIPQIPVGAPLPPTPPDPLQRETSGASVATGGTPQTRQGFWLNVGFGYGSLGCDNCGERLGGASGGLTLGGTLGDRVLLGVGTTGWYKSEDGATLSAGTVDARLRLYPVVASGFFLTGGIGFGTISLGVARIADETETGLGLMLGLGWDIRVSRNVSLTPFWNGTAVRTSTADANFGQIGLGVTIH